ncbi:IS110 family transposase (plasmid) [Gemmobacter fulvus]|uniref:IS110 family transposase n=1 Tax=Gemmobacter fulvus TaxID=2840474 RepID=A0A975PAP2_9RHOB|nr:IS110 family transposase [Gemmobacter fulvus]MBT9247677.1 IS110 family transposase [Gemmobacter fulvus]QWK92860.1 IS110 family transposase [Gemmobacter fulvus]
MCANKTGSLEDLVIFGVDIGKDTFHLVGFDRADQLGHAQADRAAGVECHIRTTPRCIVGIEACLSAHFVSRTLRGMGFEPRIIPALYVKSFNKGQKNGYNDAVAIAEAALRPNLRTVSEKDQDQLDLQALHQVRARLVSRRTASINQIRAFLIEQGITVRSGLRALKNSFEAILEQRRGEVSPRMRGILIGLYGDWLWLDKRIEDVSGEIEEISRTEENCANVMTIPGIGPMISTAMVTAVGKGEAFDRGRDFVAWVGLVPTQYSTGGRTILGRITKRGGRYLRMLFVQAAKVIMMRQNRWSTFSFGPWLTEAVKRMPRNKAAVALANKLARTAWSALRHGTRFDAPRDMAMETI